MVSDHLKIIWLSDLHVVAPGKHVVGYDSSVRVSRAVEYISAQHPDAAFCVLGGDLVDDCQPDSYRHLKSLLKLLPMPILPLVGNHDDRAALISSLRPPVPNGASTADYIVEVAGRVLICLDSQKPGHEAGCYSPQQLKWLDETLTRVSARPAYVFIHHPPMKLGLTMQDKDWLENGDEFLALLKRHSNVNHLFIGHVHRPVSGNVGRLPFTIMRPTAYQAPLPYPEWTWDNFAPAKEPPNLGVILLGDSSTIVHYHQFCDADVGYLGS